jgi:DNA polymerase-3 subunit alpha
MHRDDLLASLRNRYIEARVANTEPEFIEFEESFASIEDLQKLLEIPLSSRTNPRNSSLLYITGISDDYNPLKYVDTIGGTPPDVDIDFDTINYSKIIEWVKSYWGEENIASIMTLPRMKPRSITDKFFMVTTPRDPAAAKPYRELEKEIKNMIPPPLFGKEPTMTELVYGNPEKRGYEPHPKLLEPKYSEWYKIASTLEGMVSTFSIHAAGIVLSDTRISDHIPLWSRQTKDEYSDGSKITRVSTQFTMDEVASLGYIKFDFLRIQNLSIIQETIRLIKESKGIDISPYTIQDGDKATYDLIAKGLVGGVFQLEASDSAKELGMRIHPKNIGELSDLNALNRPGPMQSGLTNNYIENKHSGEIPEDMPEELAQLLADTYYTLCYQEQIMSIVSIIGGFTLKEADDIRRAIGKKKKELITPYRQAFIDGCTKHGVDAHYAQNFWDKVIVGLADYSFNKSHSVAYSYLSYICAYLKAHYPLEFFTALMSVRSVVLSSQVWAEKAPTYVDEAMKFGIKIKAPDINRSVTGFSYGDNTIYFGFSTITKVGETASAVIVNCRNKGGPFKDIVDFLSRINRNKINTGVFTQLAKAGAFDSMGYTRQDLLNNVDKLYDRFHIKAEYEERIIENFNRIEENKELEKLMAIRDDIRKLKKKGVESDEDNQFLLDHPRLALKRPLALPEVPEFPQLARYKKISLTITELMTQGITIGCYIMNPTFIVYPHSTRISSLTNDGIYSLAGIVTEVKKYKNSRGETHYITITDGTSSISFRLYSDKYINTPEKGQLISIRAKIEVNDSAYDDDATIESIKLIKITRAFELEIFKEID